MYSKTAAIFIFDLLDESKIQDGEVFG